MSTPTTSAPTTPADGAARARRTRILTGAVLGLTVISVVLALTRPDWLVEPLRAAVAESGNLAPLTFVGLCALLAPLRLNRVLIVLSTLVWPLPVVGILSFVGSFVGCVLTATALARTGAAALAPPETWPTSLQPLATRVGRRPLIVGLIARVGVGSGLLLEGFYIVTGYTRRQYLVVTGAGLAIWVTMAILGITTSTTLLSISPWFILLLGVPPLFLGIGAGVRGIRRRRARAGDRWGNANDDPSTDPRSRSPR
jgi:hypothetical protein